MAQGRKVVRRRVPNTRDLSRPLGVEHISERGFASFGLKEEALSLKRDGEWFER